MSFTKKELSWLEYLVDSELRSCYGHPNRENHEKEMDVLLGKLLDIRRPFRRCKTAQMCECIAHGYFYDSRIWLLPEEESTMKFFER